MLSQAHNVTSSLLDQRRTFDNVGDKLAQVGDKFPVVAGLLNAIRRKKSRVSAGAGAGCVCQCVADACSDGAVGCVLSICHADEVRELRARLCALEMSKPYLGVGFSVALHLGTGVAADWHWCCCRLAADWHR